MLEGLRCALACFVVSVCYEPYLPGRRIILQHSLQHSPAGLPSHGRHAQTHAHTSRLTLGCSENMQGKASPAGLGNGALQKAPRLGAQAHCNIALQYTAGELTTSYKPCRNTNSDTNTNTKSQTQKQTQTHEHKHECKRKSTRKNRTATGISASKMQHSCCYHHALELTGSDGAIHGTNEQESQTKCISDSPASFPHGWLLQTQCQIWMHTARKTDKEYR